MNRAAAPVVVVTHEGRSDRLRRCLDALSAAAGVGLVVLVDNSDAGDEVDPPEACVDDAFVQLRTANRGYGAAANEGFDEVRRRCPDAEVIGLLNDDVIVSPGWLEPLWEALDEGWDVAQPKLRMAVTEVAGSAIVNSVGVQLDRFAAGTDVGHGEPDGPVFEGTADIDIFTGGAVLFSAAFLEATGGFDDRYFLYYEDVDLALRGRELGMRYACAPRSIAWHEGGASTAQLGDLTRRLQERNRLWCAARFARLPTIAHALGLSVRRLRHEPKATHRSALLAGVGGMPRRLIERSSARRSGGTLDQAPTLPEGVNLLGYHRSASGLGTAVRELHTSLQAAGVPVSVFDVDATHSPRRNDSNAAPDSQLVRAHTLAVVTAPQLSGTLGVRPKLQAVHSVIGYLFWELSEVPDDHRHGVGLLDEIWAPTEFIAEAYRSGPGSPPVVHQPMYLSRPDLDDAAHTTWRHRLAPHDEFVFLVALDLFSIVERKNPFGVIDAFAAAFESTDAEVRLILKTLNGDQRPESMRRITDHVASSGIEERIDVIDEFVTDADMAAMIAAADCLVSLHRGEGLGLHMADAMWLGTTVLASRYSGNLDFMDDGAAALVDVQMIDVENGEGAYPPGFRWADPDVAHAADWMRKLVDDPTVGARLAEQARRRMERQPSEADRGRQYADALNHDGDRVASAPPGTVTD